MGSSLQDKHKHTGLVNESDLEDTDEHRLCKKSMNCLIPLTCTDQCYFFPDKVDWATLGNPVTVDTDGLLMDVDVQAIDDNLPTHEDK